MFRYVALAWDEGNPRAPASARRIAQRLLASSPSWRRTLSTSGLIVLHADARPGSSGAYVLAGDHGVVLGKLFKRHADHATVPATLASDLSEAQAIAGSAGRRLIDEYWGRYVAFVRDPARRRTWALRDPTGDLPCYSTTREDVYVYFSCAEDVASLDLLTFAPNWPFIAAFMCYPTRVQPAETGLHGVSELQPGECWEVDQGGVIRKTLLWNPIDIARAEAIEDFEQAVAAVRETTQACVWAWAECFPRIVHLLSGGLDSSIVLACLHAAPTRPHLTCLNYFDTTSSAGDEREYARLASKAADCKLVESGHGMTAPGLESLLDISRSVKPYLMQYFLNHSRFEGELAREENATALFYGNGGDQIFYQNPMIQTPADYAYRHGVGLPLLRLVAQVARSTGSSFWLVLKNAVRNGFLRVRGDSLVTLAALRMLLVSPEVLDSVLKRQEYLIHPLLRTANGLPPGKLEHLRMMWSWRDFFDPLEGTDYPQRVRPLESQPLIELCVRIPTYVLAAQGCDRAVARRAFAQILPQRIATRRAKGIIDSSLSRLLQANWEFLRGLMLDGLLVKQGLLDGRKIEELFAHGRASLGPEAQELVVLHLSTEAWLRSWTARRSLPAAASS